MATKKKATKKSCPAGKVWRKGYTRKGSRVKGTCVKKPRRRR